MRTHGFLSNRLYDALASGAFVISDAASGIDDEFDGAVATYTDRNDLRALIDRYLADPEARRAMAETGRNAVLARHTFEHRVERMIELIDQLGVEPPRGVEQWHEIAAWLDRRRRRASRMPDHAEA
jgi:spore maturation protein CgeB